MPEPTLEQLYQQLETMGKTASKMETFLAEQEKEKKEHEGKKAEDEKKEEERKEAKKAAYDAAIKTAMEEKDHEKKMAMIKKAEEDYEKEDDKHEAFGKPDDHSKDATEHEKEEKEHIASIVEKDKQILINKILTAATITAPDKVKEGEGWVKTASISELKKYAELVPDFTAGAKPEFGQPQAPTIPFMASYAGQEVDSKMLTASSPDSAFASMSTEDLLKGKIA